MTPNGNEGVGIQLVYLECMYGTRYYVINKVNGDIYAIHDISLKLTEFKGHFSPFDLENLEAKVCRLALGNGDERDAVESQRGKVKRDNSFDTAQEQMVTEAKQSKGGPVKTPGVIHNLVLAIKVIHAGHK